MQRRPDLRIALVADEFSWRCWQFEADVFTFTPRNWEAVLSERQPELVLIESAWSGVGDSWHFQFNELGHHRHICGEYLLPQVAKWCRQRGIPIAFYNKEDPPNFEIFIEAARQCDVVFTSDADCIPEYRSRLGHKRVFALPFAAQPRLHNPVQPQPRSRSVCFAGAWYAERHQSRHEDAINILLPAADCGLEIYDRMAGSSDPAYCWPEVFRPFVRGGLSYEQMLTAYRLYHVFLNVNSVADSPTMFSRRVFELLACGTPVISSHARGIAETFGEDLVLMSQDAETTRQHLARLLTDDEYRTQLATCGMRAVLSAHTYSHRLQAVLDAVGLECSPASAPRIAMLAVVNKRDETQRACESFRRQAYPHKRLLLCTHDPDAVASIAESVEGDPSIGTVAAAGATCGTLLAQALEACDCEYVAALRPRDFYGREYLTDYANATQFVTTPAFGKAAVHTIGEDGELIRPDAAGSWCIAESVEPSTVCVRRDWASQHAAGLREIRAADDWWRRLGQTAGGVYSADVYNYARIAAGAAGAAGREAETLHKHVET